MQIIHIVNKHSKLLSHKKTVIITDDKIFM
jgi:hypothetical protein